MRFSIVALKIVISRRTNFTLLVSWWGWGTHMHNSLFQHRSCVQHAAGVGYYELLETAERGSRGSRSKPVASCLYWPARRRESRKNRHGSVLLPDQPRHQSLKTFLTLMFPCSVLGWSLASHDGAAGLQPLLLQANRCGNADWPLKRKREAEYSHIIV